jgi:hypothetical protein
MTNQQQKSGHLIADIKEYVNLKLEYYRLDAVEKGSLFLGNFMLVFGCMIFGCFALLCLSFAAAYLLGDWLGSFVWGFLLIALVYVVLIAVLIRFKEALLINPMVRMLDSTIFKSNDHAQDNL